MINGSYFTNPLIFLVNTAFDFYLIALLLRILFQWVRADFTNPLSQFLMRITNPLLLPIRRILPAIGNFDTAAWLLLLLFAMLKVGIISWLTSFAVGVTAVFWLSLAELAGLFLNMLFFSILIQVILSWIAPNQYNPISLLVHQLNAPLLGVVQRWIPPFAGLDFAPIVVLILIQLSKMLLLPPLYYLAKL